MNRNQIIAISACSILLIGLYLFGKTKKPIDNNANVTSQGHQQTAPIEELDIQSYISDVNSQIQDKGTRERIENLTQANSYKELIQEYDKLDKPLAVAYYSVKFAMAKNTAPALVNAGDYCAVLLQTAPDEKARKYLNNNIISCYQRAVALDSAKTENRIKLAGAYMEDGTQPMQGVSILLDIVRKDSNNVDAQLMLGRFGLISGQIDKAIARLEKILYLQPQNSEALFLLAEAYNNQGNKQKAIELLEKCLKTVQSPDAKKEIENYIQTIKKPNG